MCTRTLFLASACLALTACAVDPIPADDAVPPTVTLSSVERGAVRTVTSSETRDAVAVTCPNGGPVGGDTAAIGAYPVHMLAVVTDAGGVAFITIDVANGVVSNVRPAGVVQTTRTVGAQEVRILSQTFARSEAVTSRIIEFDVAPSGTTMGVVDPDQFQVSAGGRDFNGNMAYTGRPVVGLVASFCR